MRKCFKLALVGLSGAVILLAAPVIYTEAVCYSDRAADADTFISKLDEADRRPEVNTYLSYPEWSIVHAYEDFAGVTRAGSESDFAYFGAIKSYWSSLCSITSLASSRGDIPGDMKAMLYVIGVSFAAEMGVKGLYEETIGRVTSWIRGPQHTPEDVFALKVADEYAAFLRQTPWYEYPFWPTLKAFWAETPVTGGNIVRKIERRIALTLEFGVKAVYAKVLGLLAGISPAALRIRSVVSGLDGMDTAADGRISIIKTLGENTVIETPRYREFTEIIRGLASRNRNIAEIAGNDDVLITVLASAETPPKLAGAAPLFDVALQSKPGWRRFGLNAKVHELASIIRALAATNAELEHVYDY